jgi:hypothetical protein
MSIRHAVRWRARPARSTRGPRGWRRPRDDVGDEYRADAKGGKFVQMHQQVAEARMPVFAQIKVARRRTRRRRPAGFPGRGTRKGQVKRRPYFLATGCGRRPAGPALPHGRRRPALGTAAGKRAALKGRATGLPPAVIRPEAPRVVRAKDFQRSRTVAELRACADGL